MCQRLEDRAGHARQLYRLRDVTRPPTGQLDEVSADHRSPMTLDAVSGFVPRCLLRIRGQVAKAKAQILSPGGGPYSYRDKDCLLLDNSASYS